MRNLFITLLYWFLGIFLFVIFIALVDVSPIAAFSLLLVAIFVTPPLSDLPSRLVHHPLSGYVKQLICLFLLTLAYRFMPS